MKIDYKEVPTTSREPHTQMQEISGQELIRKADRCVKCGLCLPECPTYRLTQDENESPRGRIAMIEGAMRGELAVKQPLISHLDSCLLCRRCERLCPSQVQYGDLMDGARRAMAVRKPRLWDRWAADAGVLSALSRVARAFPAALSRPFGGLHRMHRFARALGGSQPPPRPGEYRARRPTGRGRVGLFPGCVTAAQQGGALHAAIKLLTHAGFSVVVPDSHLCCGALEQHAGRADAAERRATLNRAAFDTSLTALVSIASGCGTHLDSYDPPLPVRHYDVHRFLLDHAAFTPADFAPLATSVMLHTPCSMENVYRGGDWPKTLLGMIPDIRILPAGERGQCCGAAGDYMLRHPGTADALRRPIVEPLPGRDAKVLLTANVGCAMHLAEGLRAQSSAIEVLHPVELLARQLRDAPATYDGN